MTIPIGTSHTTTAVVTPENTAAALGSGQLEVFSTPSMIALMEQAASQALLPYLEQGQSSVGTVVNIQHTKASPLGMEVTATATVIQVDRRKVEFTVTATTPAGEIGKGLHTRFIIDLDSFMEQTENQHR